MVVRFNVLGDGKVLHVERVSTAIPEVHCAALHGDDVAAESRCESALSRHKKEVTHEVDKVKLPPLLFVAKSEGRTK